jgi:hypothetical protein
MSLYNMLYGTNSQMDAALKAAGLSDANLGRIRDAYFVNDNQDIVVAVFTRNGGGNRDCIHDDSDTPTCDITGDLNDICYGCVITHAEELFPNFIRDEDDDCDSTYATMYFTILPEFKEQVCQAIKENPSLIVKSTFGERFEKTMELLENTRKMDDIHNTCTQS